jgi:hypothetical protein
MAQKEWCITSKHYHSGGWLRTEQMKPSRSTSQLRVPPFNVFRRNRPTFTKTVRKTRRITTHSHSTSNTAATEFLNFEQQQHQIMP